jgi:type I restriction enzyme M protein
MENTGNIGFEETLWKSADKLRGSMDASEYKHVVLGLIFLKYISDKFETKYNELVAEGEGFEEDRDEYEAENIFWVPKEARWTFIMDNAKDVKIGQYIDDAMILIEKENTSLKGVLDKRYARPEIDKRRLGELIDLISTIKLHDSGEKDLLGRVYEYFLGQFASVEGKGGGEFYTPTSVVKTLVEMIEPYQGRVYDPCCGSGGMFVQSEKFVEDHQGKIENLSIYGQEMNATTWKLCKMNLAIRGLDANLGSHHDDTLKKIAQELTIAIRNNITIDWSVRKSAQASMRKIIKRLLRYYKYPPEQADQALKIVMRQAEKMCGNEVAEGFWYDKVAEEKAV